MTTTTATTFEGKNQLINMHSDFYKDVNGIRPRWINYDNWTKSDFDKEFKELGEEMEENHKREVIQKDMRIVEFKALIQKTITMGAGDEKTALRWIFEGADVHWFDIDYFIYLYGFGYTDYATEITDKLKQIYQELEQYKKVA